MAIRALCAVFLVAFLCAGCTLAAPVEVSSTMKVNANPFYCEEGEDGEDCTDASLAAQ